MQKPLHFPSQKLPKTIRRLSLPLIAVFIFLLTGFANGQKPDTINVYYLGGQSNMEGYGYNTELPDSLDKTFNDVWIFHGNPADDGDTKGGRGIWKALKPGHGAKFQSNGQQNQLSKRFGIELSFAQYFKSMHTGEKIALIKYAKGGSAIDSLAGTEFGCWEPKFRGENGINQYDHFLKTVKSAMAVNDINNDGTKDVLIPRGIIWMQGESDADHTEAVAKEYYKNVKGILELIRAAFLNDDIPVVLGKISDSWKDEEDGKVWDYGDLVQYAQEKYARTDKNAAIVRTTRYYNYSDKWHYDSEGFIDLGKQFADAISKLNKQDLK